MRFKTPTIIITALLGVAVLGGCTETASQNADKKTAQTVGNQQQIYTTTQPVPLYDYSAQRDTLIQIYNATVSEMRPSWHVFSTPGVGITDSCAGVGVGIPYSTQLTNPQYVSEWGYNGAGPAILPQPEPDGTYKPDATAGTWVLCDFGMGIEPVYVEDQVRTYFHPITVEDGKVIHESVKASVTINLKK